MKMALVFLLPPPVLIAFALLAVAPIRFGSSIVLRESVARGVRAAPPRFYANRSPSVEFQRKSIFCYAVLRLIMWQSINKTSAMTDMMNPAD